MEGIPIPDARRRPPEPVLEAYGFQGATVTNENAKARKAVWFVERPGRTWVLKQSPLDEERLRFVLAAWDHLRARGIGLPARVPARDGRPYVLVPEGLFFVMELACGHAPSYDAPGDRTRILHGLARFHRASEGFSHQGCAGARVQLGEWPRLYRKRLDRLAQAEGAGPVWEAARPHLPFFLEAGRLALEELQRSAYSDWVESVRRRGGLCHQDFAAGNLVLEPSGGLVVLDLDSVSVEIPARDLRKLLVKVLKKQGAWDDEQARRMLSDYHQVNPLRPEQYEVLRVDLLFPHLFHGLVDKALTGRAPDWTQGKFLSKLREVVAFERAKAEALAGSGALLPDPLGSAPVPDTIGGDR
ncbi:CotS family spore coat protein [Limnochorda pilosa]|uniref:Homoserine kinase n=1 Tax=Limnochorda pilosa TaxID=1555112 RepID=A0A0K2SNH1_LIMPI|nr:CotS family spore coat protein [Limnochorda pilosa]BAS28389.1 homoserine kinase [Limnochorda pilosa]